MQGTLCRTKRDWLVEYNVVEENNRQWKYLPLHPDDISKISATYIRDDYSTGYIYDNTEVEFEIVEGEWEGIPLGKTRPLTHTKVSYAKLQPSKQDSTPNIYESPDKGKTVYKRKFGDYTNRVRV